MTWFDIVGVLLIVLIAWLESIRGFGRALFDMAGAIIALKAAPEMAAPLAKMIPVMGSAGGNESFWLAASFLLLALFTLLAARLIYQSTLLSLDYLDPIVGSIFGVVSGIITAFIFLRVLQLGYGASEQATILLNSFVGQEILKLRAYHYVVNALQNLGK
jgi:uncharacterized membrane protein required for colicin V production